MGPCTKACCSVWGGRKALLNLIVKDVACVISVEKHIFPIVCDFIQLPKL